MKTEEVGGASDARTLAEMEMTPAEMQLYNAAGEAIEKVMSASPQAQAKRAIEAAALVECASDEARIAVANQIVGFARMAADFLDHGDFRGLLSSMSALHHAVTSAASIAPPTPPRMPGSDAFYFAGWSTGERIGLRNILSKGLCGVIKGDRVVSIDADEATLASGTHLSRKQAFDAYPPEGPKMIAVGSFPAMLALIQRRKS